MTEAELFQVLDEFERHHETNVVAVRDQAGAGLASVMSNNGILRTEQTTGMALLLMRVMVENLYACYVNGFIPEECFVVAWPWMLGCAQTIRIGVGR